MAATGTGAAVASARGLFIGCRRRAPAASAHRSQKISLEMVFFTMAVEHPASIAGDYEAFNACFGQQVKLFLIHTEPR